MIRRLHISHLLILIALFFIIASNGCTWNVKATKGGVTVCVTWSPQVDTSTKQTRQDDIEDEQEEASDDEIAEIIENMEIGKQNEL